MWVLKVIALVVLVWGVIRLSMGLYVAIAFDGSQSATTRYLGSGTSGEAIDQGIYMVLISIALLIIVRSARKKRSS